MADVKDWGTSAGQNDVASPDGAQTGWLGGDVGPWARETMSGVARWYADPAWVNFTRYGIEPAGDKTITRATGTSVSIVTSGPDWGSDVSDIFCDGRLIRLLSPTAGYFMAIITSTFSAGPNLGLNLALIGDAEIPVGTTFANNGCEFFVAMDTVDDSTSGPRKVQTVGPIIFGGEGTTSERDAKFPDVTVAPEGIIWVNTEESALQIIDKAAWESIAPLTDTWFNSGSRMVINADTYQGSVGGSVGPSIDLVSRVVVASGASSALNMYEVDAATPGIQDSSAQLLANRGSAALSGPDFDTTDASKVTGAIQIVGNEGAPAGEEGKLFYILKQGNGSGQDVVERVPLTPGDVNAGQLGGVDAVIQNAALRERTGAGTEQSVFGTYVLMHSGQLSSEMAALLTSNDWDEAEFSWTLVYQSLFSGSPSSGGNYGWNMYLGEDYDVTPPPSLSTGETFDFVASHPGFNPYVINPSSDRLFRSALPAVVNSFAISLVITGVGNPQQVTWLNSSGNSYSGFSVDRFWRVAT